MSWQTPSRSNMGGFKVAGLVVLCTAMLSLAAWLASELWALTAFRYRPWQLESLLEIRTGSLRASDYGGIWSRDIDELEARLQGARLCLSNAESSWTLSRDYTPCLNSLLGANLDAFSLAVRQSLREEESSVRLEVMLVMLDRDGGALLRSSNGSLPAAARAAATRKKSLLEEAESLRSMGRHQAALHSALRAQVSLRTGRDLQEEALARFADESLLALWDRQVENLLGWSRRSGLGGIIVDKLEHRCYLILRGRTQESYRVNLGRNWYEDKQKENDAATPEGVYKVTRKFISRQFGWALPLDYPNPEDRRRFAALKSSGRLPRNARIGGNIEIHGRGRPDEDWTDGCVALEDEDMKELYARAYNGMPVVIVGTSRAGAPWKR